MKMTKKRLVFFLLHLLFSAVVPIALVIVRYSTIANTKAAVGFKISITGVLLLIFVFWVIKKLFIDRKLIDLKAQGNIMLANLMAPPKTGFSNRKPSKTPPSFPRLKGS